jgi:ATP-binding cassette subfamily F protein 3
LLLLDEPTNHLDMESCDSLIEALAQFDGSVLMVTHNEMYLHALAQRLIIFDKDRVSLFEGTYQDFLDKVGWEDETDLKSSDGKAPAKSLTKADRKAQKKMKAELLQEKTRVLKPMSGKIIEIESAIEQLESEFRENTELLVKASNEGNVDAIVELPKKNGILRPQIDDLYEQLEGITSTYEKESLEFQNRLEKLQ